MIDEKTENVLSAALPVFLRYGYKRTTMGDIAAAAKISRPALYLIFPSKEEIFSAVLAEATSSTLKEIHDSLIRLDTAEEKLKQTFEIWCVRPFEMTQASPDARDLLESGHLYAADVITKGLADFEKIITQILEQLTPVKVSATLTPIQIARIMIGAMIGFKQSAKDSTQLRQMIAGLVALVLANFKK